MNSIGKTIKFHRLKAGITQEELGKKVFVSKQAVSKWENGKTLPDIEMIKKLAEILSIPHNEILGDSLNQARKYQKWVEILIPVLVISILLTLFAMFDGFGFIQRRFQSGVAVVTLYENDDVVNADEYQISTLNNLKSGNNGYSFNIDHGEVKGIIVTPQDETIEFGFVNTNNWHNVQIIIRINTMGNARYVVQTVIYKTDDDQIAVLKTEDIIDENNIASVYREGI